MIILATIALWLGAAVLWFIVFLLAAQNQGDVVTWVVAAVYTAFVIWWTRWRIMRR